MPRFMICHKDIKATVVATPNIASAHYKGEGALAVKQRQADVEICEHIPLSPTQTAKNKKTCTVLLL